MDARADGTQAWLDWLGQVTQQIEKMQADPLLAHRIQVARLDVAESKLIMAAQSRAISDLSFLLAKGMTARADALESFLPCHQIITDLLLERLPSGDHIIDGGT